jgi:hypothetical protein
MSSSDGHVHFSTKKVMQMGREKLPVPWMKTLHFKLKITIHCAGRIFFMENRDDGIEKSWIYVQFKVAKENVFFYVQRNTEEKFLQKRIFN